VQRSGLFHIYYLKRHYVNTKSDISIMPKTKGKAAFKWTSSSSSSPRYQEVPLSPRPEHDEDEDDKEETSEQSLLGHDQEIATEVELRSLRTRVRILLFTSLIALLTGLGLGVAITHAATKHTHSCDSTKMNPGSSPSLDHGHHAMQHDQHAVIPPQVGTDPSGFVPLSIGEPRRYVPPLNSSSPYFLPEDVFLSPSSAKDAVARMKQAHNASSVRVGYDYASGHRVHPADWVHANGRRTNLPVHVSPQSKGQGLYVIRGLYQMDCLVRVVEEMGWLYERQGDHSVDDGDEVGGGKEGMKNGKSKAKSQGNGKHEQVSENSYGKRDEDVGPWGPEHVAHCLNTLRDAVMCSADATPISWVNGYEQGRVTDDQQAACRNWDDLRSWADEEGRSGEVVWDEHK
jgi:hypothetical protein